MKRLRHIIEYLAAFVIITLLLFAIASVVVIRFYGPELKEYTTRMINEQLDTRVYAEEAGISVFRKFPYTSVVFRNVTAWSGHGFNREDITEVSPDTLFSAESVSLQFHLLDLLRKRYRVKNLQASNGTLRLLRDQEGKGNYTLFRSKQSDTARLFLDLKGMEVKDFSCLYINRAKEMRVDLTLDQFRLDGEIMDVNYRLSADMKAYLHTIDNGGINYTRNQPFRGSVSFRVHDRRFTIQKGALELGEIRTNTSGSITLLEKEGADLDLHFTARKIAIPWVLDLVAETSGTAVDDIAVSGTLDVEARARGITSSTTHPAIEAEFRADRLELTAERLPFGINELSLSGSYDNGNNHHPGTSSVTIDRFRASAGASTLSGSMVVESFLKPRFRVNAEGEITASDVIAWSGVSSIREAEGSLQPEFTLAVRLERNPQEERSLVFQPGGTIRWMDVGFRAGKEEVEVSGVSGRLVMAEERWSWDLEGNSGESDFRITGSSEDLLNHLFGKEQSLYLYTELQSRYLDLDPLLAGVKEAGGGEGLPGLPETLRVRLGVSVDRLERKKFLARQVRGSLFYSHPNLVVDSLSMEAMSGRVSGKLGMFDLDTPRPTVSLTSQVTSLDIEQLFRSFSNFGQDFITDRNIRGSLTGRSQFSSTLDEQFTIRSRDIVSENSISIESGALIDFEPLMEVSDFLKIEPMDRVMFSRLENDIMIRNSEIVIPEMDIRSSAMNLRASGVHRFDKTYRYNLALKLSEILFRKAEANTDREFRVALDEEDQRTLFLRMEDDGSGMEVSYDREKAMKKIKSDLKQEKDELKKVLNEEFGLYEDEQENLQQEKKEEGPAVRFEFQGESEPDTVKKEREEKRRWWQRKRKKDTKPDFKIVIDEEEL